MQNQHFKRLSQAAPMAIFVLLMLCGSAGCSGQEPRTAQPVNPPKSDSTNQTSTAKAVGNDSIPFRFLPSKEQDKLRPREPYHKYGDVVLERYGGTYSLLANGRQIIREVHPGILVYDQPTSESHTTTNWRIEYYDISTKKLKKRLNLEEISPYRHEKYKNIDFGGFGGGDAGDEIPPDPDSNGVYPKLPAPDNYRTNNYVTLSPGGHVCVQHELYKIAGNMFVGFEVTLVVYDPSGREMQRMTMNNSVVSPYVSTDGKYLAFVYGTRNTDNFFDDWNGTLVVYDLKSGKKILHYVFEKGERISGISEVERDGWLNIQSRANFDQNHVNRVVLADLHKRELSQRVFSKAEWNEVVKNWKSYTDLVQKYQFTSKKY